MKSIFIDAKDIATQEKRFFDDYSTIGLLCLMYTLLIYSITICLVYKALDKVFSNDIPLNKVFKTHIYICMDLLYIIYLKEFIYVQ